MTRDFMVSIRLSERERAFLESAAHVHAMPLATYIRSSAVLKTHADIEAAIARGRDQYQVEKVVAESGPE